MHPVQIGSGCPSSPHDRCASLLEHTNDIDAARVEQALFLVTYRGLNPKRAADNLVRRRLVHPFGGIHAVP